MKKELHLSVVIATYNGYNTIERCLESFTNQSIGPDLYEVIVVNNNSTDDTESLVRPYVERYDNFVLLLEKQPGVSYARNKGISYARGDYICFIDDDAYADTKWLENIKNACGNQNPEPVVIGGEILPYYITEKPAWFKDSFEIRTMGKNPRFLNKNECSTGFPESNFTVKRKVLDEIGKFSTDFGPKGEKMGFGEGSELSARITEKYPHFWYDPGIFVYHLAPKRNMSVKYILSRKYTTGYLYQAFHTPSAGFLKNCFTLSTCVIRIIWNAFLSIVCVRWFTKKAIGDWLYHVTTLVSLTARSVFIMKYFLGRRD